MHLFVAGGRQRLARSDAAVFGKGGGGRLGKAFT